MDNDKVNLLLEELHNINAVLQRIARALEEGNRKPNFVPYTPPYKPTPYWYQEGGALKASDG